ncbi:MAG: hypothetical protein AAF289_18785 [Cyanobacteria bacterium P01_A01_bin.135]
MTHSFGGGIGYEGGVSFATGKDLGIADEGLKFADRLEYGIEANKQGYVIAIANTTMP